MRVATRTLHQEIKRNIVELAGGMNSLNEKISTGKSLNRPSDNPLAVIDTLGIKSALSRIDQYLRNMKLASSWVNLSENAIGQVQEIVERAQEVGIQMASDTQSAATRAQGAKEIGSLLDQAIALGNSELGGRYIFAGYRVQTQPFLKIEQGGLTTVRYEGDGNNYDVQTGKGEYLTVGKNGGEVFIGAGVFDALGSLKKALEDNVQGDIQQALGALRSAHDRLQNQSAEVGAKANRLEINESILKRLSLDMTDRLSRLEDTDLAEAALSLQKSELSYQAALMAAVKINELSLLNYLR